MMKVLLSTSLAFVWAFATVSAQTPGAIVSTVNGACFDINEGFTGRGANAQLWWPCHSEPNQDFILKSLGRGAFHVIARHSGKCLAVEEASFQTGANIIQNDCTFEGYTAWNFTKIGENYQIRNFRSGKCIHGIISQGNLMQGNNLVQLNCNGAPSSLFRVDAQLNREFNPFRFIQNGRQENNLCLDVANGSLQSGADVGALRCQRNSDSQNFQFIKVYNGFYQIVNKRSGRCVAVNGNNVIQASCCVEDYMLWRITGNFIVSKYWRNKCLNIPRLQPRTTAIVSPCTSQFVNFQWLIRE